MKKLLIFVFTFLFATTYNAQILLNGDFSLGTLFWGCGVETNVETTYGGSAGLNTVAEVDAVSSMCQTITGLTIGKVYLLTFSATRRTGSCPGPTTTNVDVTISGVLAVTVIRTNTVFGFSTSSYLFIATSTSHMLTFTGGSGFGGSTCGMIIDNITIATSALPVELASFTGSIAKNTVSLTWTTMSEKNNDRFEVEKSDDGMNFHTILAVPSAAQNGNSTKKLTYEAKDPAPVTTLSYYRLKQIDKDQSVSPGKIIAIAAEANNDTELMLYPNPSNGGFTLRFAQPEKTSIVSVMLYGLAGKIVYSQFYEADALPGGIVMDMRGKVNPGHYYCVVTTTSFSKRVPIIIME